MTRSPSPSRIALVIAGGDPPPADLLAFLPPPVITVAADSGIHHARSLDLDVDLVVGDLDSADEDAVAWAVERGAEVDVHPAAKDQTDLELALSRAVEATAGRDGEEAVHVTEVVVVGLGGGRLDHWLANLLTLGGSRTSPVDVTAYIDRSRISVIRTGRTLTGRPGELISLLPVGGPVEGITTSGLDYRLDGETLDAGSSRGVSNLFAASTAEAVSADITITSGVLLAVQPEFLVSANR